jgi:endonuclease YncB( thermonuclease family)
MMAGLVPMGLIGAALMAASPSRAEDRPIYQVPAAGVSLATGDSWSYGGHDYRLYGVQACLRGTFFTDARGQKTDCGEASLAYLAAILEDTHPVCAGVAQLSSPADPIDATIIVVCGAKVGSSTLDLGTILVTQGFAFAAYSKDGKPAYAPYVVAEQQAAQRKAGLWAYADLPHPNEILLKAARHQK